MLVLPFPEQLNIFFGEREIFLFGMYGSVCRHGKVRHMTKKKEKMDWGGFLNMRLSSEQKEEFTHWHRELGDDVWELFLQVLAQGMKFSLVYDADNDTYTASLTNSPRNPCGVSSLYVLSAYAQEWQTAVALVLFKHLYVLGGTWENYRPSRTIQDKFG